MLMRTLGTALGFVILALFLTACGGRGGGGAPVAVRFFSADDGTTGQELWKSDGTAEGTALFKDFCPGPCDGQDR